LLDTCFPSAVPKAFFPKGLQHENQLVAFLVSNFLVACLQKARSVVEALEDVSRRLEEDVDGNWTVAARTLRETLRERLPDPQILIALIQRYGTADMDASATPTDGSDMLVLSALRLIWQYHLLLPSVGPSIRFDFSKLLGSRLAHATNEPVGALSQTYLLKLVGRRETILTWNGIMPLVELYVTTSLATVRSEAVATLKKLLGTSIVFEHNVDELDVWLSGMPPHGNPARHSVVTFFGSAIQAALNEPFRYLESAQKLGSAPETLSSYSALAAAALERLADPSNLDVLDKLAKYALALVIGFCGLYPDLTFAKAFAGRVSEILGKERRPFQKSLRRVLDTLQGEYGSAELGSFHPSERYVCPPLCTCSDN
jgi:nucleolar pre-ribosomal-associated protein 1